MKDLHGPVTRRGFGRAVATAGIGAIGVAALRADDQNSPPPVRRGAFREDHEHHGDDHDAHAGARPQGPDAYFQVKQLPFHLQHEFMHAISCNNAAARADQVDFGGQDTHAIRQQPNDFGWGTLTFFLRLDPRLVGQEMTFMSTVGWNGQAEGEVMFSVEINGDIVIDGARSTKNEWMPVQRVLPVKSAEMRVTLLVDSIRGDNDFTFWWGEPQLMASDGQTPGREHEHEHRDDAQPRQPEGRPALRSSRP